MAVDVGSRGSLKADVNVTPLVDVMLVLRDVPLTLPEANNGGDKPDTQGQTVVAIDSRSRFYVNLIPVTAGELVPRVQRALEERNEKVVYLKGDKDANYSAIMNAMDALRKAHIENIALITERKQDRRGTTAGDAR